MRLAQSGHSDFTLQLPLFIRTCVFFKDNSSSEIDKIYGMHKPFHSCCLTNFLTVAELPSKVKSNMIPPDILITFSVTRMLQFAPPPLPLRPCILFEIDGSKTYRGGGCELQKTKQNKKKKNIYIYILLGKSLQNKSTLNHARATQRGEREKKEGENLGSRGEGGRG